MERPRRDGGGCPRRSGPASLPRSGPRPREALESHGLSADVVAKEFVGESLASEMLGALRRDPVSPRVLLARAAKARDVVPEALRAAGCRVDVVTVYETNAPPQATVEALVRELEQGRIDVAMFTSSSTVENFCDLVGPRAVALLRGVRVATIGPVTKETARIRGLKVEVMAREYSVGGLIEALVESYGEGGG